MNKEETQQLETKQSSLLSLKETQNHGKITQNPLLSPQTGTATSSPIGLTASPIFQCCWELRKAGYAESTVVAVGKRLRHVICSLSVHAHNRSS